MRTRHESQAMLIAVWGTLPALVLAGEGAELLEELDASGPYLEDLGWDKDDFPDEPGLHVWEGALETCEDDAPLWVGAWRRATAADLGRFGMTLDATEDGTDG